MFITFSRKAKRKSADIMSSTRLNAISLYKNILRAHARYLPHEMKQLGDSYVRAEVREFSLFF